MSLKRMIDLTCPHCRHQHSGRALAFICIGCPCTWIPDSTTVAPADPPARPAHSHVVAMTRAEFDGVIRRAEELAGEQLGRFIEGAAVDALLSALREQLDVELPDGTFGIEVVPAVTQRLRKVGEE